MDTVKYSAFMKVVRYLEENDEEQTTSGRSYTNYGIFLEETGKEGYSTMYMKAKLQEHFGKKKDHDYNNTKQK